MSSVHIFTPISTCSLKALNRNFKQLGFVTILFDRILILPRRELKNRTVLQDLSCGKRVIYSKLDIFFFERNCLIYPAKFFKQYWF